MSVDLKKIAAARHKYFSPDILNTVIGSCLVDLDRFQPSRIKFIGPFVDF